MTINPQKVLSDRRRVLVYKNYKPGVCFKCKKECKTEPHHVVYTKPTIRFLCHSCHKTITAINRRSVKDYIKLTDKQRWDIFNEFIKTPLPLGVSIE